MMAESRADVELSDLEGDSFIPSRHGPKRVARRENAFARKLPPRLRGFVHNLSRVKLMLLVLATFIVGLVFLGFVNEGGPPVTVPPGSIAVYEKVAEGLMETSIPQYVLAYAPLVFLDKNELYYPSDLAAHVANTHPTANFTAIPNVADPLTLENLDSVNAFGGEEVYLTSNSDVTKLPEFMAGQRPSSSTLQTKGATSSVVILVDKGKGVVDVFYMYFYTFNQGPSVAGHEIGDHLGDWEHNMIRFNHELPESVWYSQHEYGEAFTYDAVQKIGRRPVAFSAKGSHANYAVAASHDLHDGNPEVPEKVAFDHTSHGPLWDPLLSTYFHTYDPSTKKFAAARERDDTPLGYLNFEGRWGDPEYPEGHPGQEIFEGWRKWSGGPRGPLDKHLDRKSVCLPKRPECDIKSSI